MTRKSEKNKEKKGAENKRKLGAKIGGSPQFPFFNLIQSKKALPSLEINGDSPQLILIFIYLIIICIQLRL